jgi:hypothetical protein
MVVVYDSRVIFFGRIETPQCEAPQTQQQTRVRILQVIKGVLVKTSPFRAIPNLGRVVQPRPNFLDAGRRSGALADHFCTVIGVPPSQPDHHYDLRSTYLHQQLSSHFLPLATGAMLRKNED